MDTGRDVSSENEKRMRQRVKLLASEAAFQVYKYLIANNINIEQSGNLISRLQGDLLLSTDQDDLYQYARNILRYSDLGDQFQYDELELNYLINKGSPEQKIKLIQYAKLDNILKNAIINGVYSSRIPPTATSQNSVKSSEPKPTWMEFIKEKDFQFIENHINTIQADDKKSIKQFDQFIAQIKTSKDLLWYAEIKRTCQVMERSTVLLKQKKNLPREKLSEALKDCGIIGALIDDKIGKGGLKQIQDALPLLQGIKLLELSAAIYMERNTDEVILSRVHQLIDSGNMLEAKNLLINADKLISLASSTALSYRVMENNIQSSQPARPKSTAITTDLKAKEASTPAVASRQTTASKSTAVSTQIASPTSTAATTNNINDNEISEVTREHDINNEIKKLIKLRASEAAFQVYKYLVENNINIEKSGDLISRLQGDLQLSTDQDDLYLYARTILRDSDLGDQFQYNEIELNYLINNGSPEQKLKLIEYTKLDSILKDAIINGVCSSRVSPTENSHNSVKTSEPGPTWMEFIKEKDLNFIENHIKNKIGDDKVSTKQFYQFMDQTINAKDISWYAELKRAIQIMERNTELLKKKASVPREKLSQALNECGIIGALIDKKIGKGDLKQMQDALPLLQGIKLLELSAAIYMERNTDEVILSRVHQLIDSGNMLDAKNLLKNADKLISTLKKSPQNDKIIEDSITDIKKRHTN